MAVEPARVNDDLIEALRAVVGPRLSTSAAVCEQHAALPR